jgi:hypothetical protein
MGRTFSKIYITAAGMAAKQYVLATGGGVSFTRAQCGTGTPGADADLTLISGLYEPAFDCALTENYAEAATHHLVVRLDNVQNTEEATVHELGVFARTDADEFLYAYMCSDFGLYVPANDTRAIQSFVIDTTLAQSENVTIQTDDRSIFATLEDVDGLWGVVTQVRAQMPNVPKEKLEALPEAVEDLRAEIALLEEAAGASTADGNTFAADFAGLTNVKIIQGVWDAQTGTLNAGGGW